MNHARLLIACFFLTLANILDLSLPLCDAGLPVVPPRDAGMDGPTLDRIDQVIDEGLRYGRMPGAVVVVGHEGQIVYRRAFGYRQIKPREIPMTIDTVFDLASLTKPIATATSIMKLIEKKQLDISAPVSRYLPEFGRNGKQSITVQQLLTHTGGLIPDNALSDYANGKAQAMENIFNLQTYREPGSDFVYTDVGFIVLAALVEKISGQDIHAFTQAELFSPLGMHETGYNPAANLRLRAVTTQQREGRWMQGEVHDPRAYAMGGVAGHAGLFSTADDLALFAQMLLNEGTLAGQRVLEPRTVELMTTGQKVPRGLRTLGWDMRTGYSSNRGDLMSSRAFGHGGFTGTALWIDPELDLFVVFLSNRVHPDGKGSVNPTAGRIGTIAAASLKHRPLSTPEPAITPVLNGIDVLHKRDYALLKNRRIGLITNHTGVDRTGVSTVQRLLEAEHVKLVTLFSPEHGFAGQLDVAKIDDSTDEGSGLKVISLYGATRQPTEEHLADIDTLVFDIQDIGTRFYTYVSTMGLAMQAASQSGKSFVVLDRPNPIGGTAVEGPVLDDGSESFVGFHPVCVRHGMTVGELARMIAAERKWDLDLTIVECQQWNRRQWLDATGYAWINPSPNMRNLNQATLYPGVGLLETTNLSVGRGTDAPFELIGAPWIDSRKLANALNAAGIPGIRALPVSFQPESSKFSGQTCHGLNFIITDRQRFQPVQLGLTLACLLRKLHNEDWKTDALNRLLSDQRIFEAIVQGQPVERILPMFEAERRSFLDRRSRFLLY